MVCTAINKTGKSIPSQQSKSPCKWPWRALMVMNTIAYEILRLRARQSPIMRELLEGVVHMNHSSRFISSARSPKQPDLLLQVSY
jgi:hypothetical protein